MDTLDYILSVEEKSMEHYEFVRNHFDFPVDIDYQKFIDCTERYVIAVRMNNNNPINNIGFLIGVSIIKMIDDKINIDYVAIDKEYRRKGINRVINNLVEEIALANYIDYLTANIRETNINSINSFTRCGFEVDKNRVCKYNNGDVKVHVIKKLDLFKEEDKCFIKKEMEKLIALSKILPELKTEEEHKMMDNIKESIKMIKNYLNFLLKK
jgi:ribosomal protein S18 acetylase RimI-like enzyme